MKKIVARGAQNSGRTARRTLAPLRPEVLAHISGGDGDDPIAADHKHISGVKYEG